MRVKEIEEKLMTSAGDSEDRELIEAIKRGESTAFERIVKKYQSTVYNTIYHVLQREAEVDDIAQEVFIRVYKSIQSFRGESAFSTWLYRITVNCCRDRIKAYIETRTEQLTITTQEGEKPREIPDHFADPQRVYSDREFVKTLRGAIADLPENYRIALTLREFEELSYEEIARVLNTTPPAAKNLVYRAKIRLKEMLDKIL